MCFSGGKKPMLRGVFVGDVEVAAVVRFAAEYDRGDTFKRRQDGR